MSIFGKIMGAIFGTHAEAATPAPAPAGGGAPASGSGVAPADSVDVAAILDKAVAAKKENPAIAEDMNHAHLPAGVDGKTRELHLGFPILVYNFTKFPQACKAFTAFLMEPAQFDPWVWARCRDSVYNPYLDPDNDQDGIPNSQDTDDNGDGTPDGQDPDDDVDGIPDSLDPWPALNVATHAALLRYREWWANQ